MPLVRAPATPATATTPTEAADNLRDALAAADPDARRHAARALASDVTAATALAARLETETEPAVRDALFDSLVAIGGPEPARLIAPFLRSDEAALRGAAIEALKQLGEGAVPALVALLDDADPDVRLLAIEVTRVWPSERAEPLLRRVLLSDPHVNVCGAAVDVATEVATAALIPALTGLRTRFPNEPFLLFAVGIACSRISAGDGRGS
jgi:HEAT repeat protein